MHRSLITLVCAVTFLTAPLAAQSDNGSLEAATGTGAITRLLRLHDQLLIMEVLLGDRSAASVPAALADRADSITDGSGPGVARLLSRHGRLADRFFTAAARDIDGIDGPQRTEGRVRLAAARRQYETEIAAGNPPTAALQQALSAIALSAGVQVPPDADPFAGERARVTAALDGEPVDIPAGVGGPPTRTASGGDATGGAPPNGRVGADGRKPFDDDIIVVPPPSKPLEDDVVVLPPDGQPHGDGGGVGDPRGGLATHRPSTLVYHQVTTFDDDVQLIENRIRLSGDGRRLLFADRRAPHALYTCLSDGSGLRTLIDAEGGTSQMDLCDDGRLAMLADYYTLRVVPTDGSSPRTLYRNAYGNIRAAVLAGDGRSIVYVVGRGEDRGLYRIGTDGRGRQRIVSFADLAGPMGVKEDNVRRLLSNGVALDVSYDGSRIVFAAHNDAWGIVPAAAGLYGVRGDGSGLHRILGGLEWVHGVGISGDGHTVAYVVQRDDELPFGGAVGFDGRGDRQLAEHKQLQPGGSSTPTRQINLSHDGSLVVIGYRTILLATDGSGATPLGAPFGHGTRLGERLVYFWPSADMRRGAFTFKDEDGRAQLAMLHLDPSSTGAAPRVGNVDVFPPEIAVGSGDVATVCADVSAQPQTALRSVTLLMHRDGYYPSSLGTFVLVDDGKHDDGDADDGRFGTNGVRAARGVPVGRAFVRIKAEVRDARNRLHATVVEAPPLDLISIE